MCVCGLTCVCAGMRVSLCVCAHMCVCQHACVCVRGSERATVGVCLSLREKEHSCCVLLNNEKTLSVSVWKTYRRYFRAKICSMSVFSEDSFSSGSTLG